MPTLLDVYHVAEKPWMQGRSLLRPLIAGQSGRMEERTFFIQNSSGILGIVRGPYKYIRTAPQMIGSFCRPAKQEELYDLEKDPGETKDVSADRPDLISFFREQYAMYEEKAAAYRKSVRRPGETQTILIDTNTREQLRALGYIQ
jgi:arylsulfatase A-like enzyme